MVTQLGWQHRQSSSDPAWRFSSNIRFELNEYICTMYKLRQNLKTCLNQNREMCLLIWLARGPQPFFAGTSALRPELISQAMERCLRWHLTLPRPRCPLQKNVAFEKERKSANKGRNFKKRRKPENCNEHGSMRT